MKWLLLRGLVREQRHWGEFPRLFRSYLEAAVGRSDIEVVCLDLPGTGVECQLDSPWSIDGIVEDLRRRWLKLSAGSRGDWSLLGISLGGMIAMQWCSKYPEDFKNLVLVNSSAGNLSPPWKRLHFRTLPYAFRAGICRDPIEREHRILRMTTRLPLKLEEIASKWASFTQEFPVKRGTGIRQLSAAFFFKAPEELNLNTLVVTTERDGFTDPSCSRALAKHLCAPIVVHPGGGHDLPLDDPEWLAREISEWVSSPRV